MKPGLPQWLSSKESACNAADTGSVPELGRSPGGGNGNPLQYSCLDNSMDRETWQDRVHRVTKSQTHTTEHLTLSLSYNDLRIAVTVYTTKDIL